VEADERFAALAEEFAVYPDVQLPGESTPRTFGATALKVNGSIFAMATGEGLVLKLPGQRVTALIGSGRGAPFDAGKGTPMKEWVTITEENPETWTALAREALDFVRSRSQKG
jgi:hypothetical protein